MTAHDELTSALRLWREADDPWAEAYQDRISRATDALRARVGELAETGDTDALRVHEQLSVTTQATHVASLVGSELQRLEAGDNPKPPDETVWCGECRRRVVVWDVDPHCSYYSGNHEIEHTVTHLECGHTLEGPERIIGASPGGEAAAEAIAGAAIQRRLERAAAWQEAGW